MNVTAMLFLSCLLVLPQFTDGFHSKMANFRSTTPDISIRTGNNGRGSMSTTKKKQFRKHEQISTTETRKSILFSSLNDDGSKNNKKNPRKRQRARKLILVVRKAIVRAATKPSRMVVRFRSLSKKGKILMATQTLTVLMLFGSVGRSVYKQQQMRQGLGTATGPPIEVPYSTFLELVENSDAAKKKGYAKVDNMRISPERIVYRLTKEVPSDETDSDSPSVKELVCYTNKIAASPELIDTLHKNNIPFTAANRQRQNNIAIAARTAILGFYMLILFRMYKSFSGNASGSGDVPGKVANKNALPLASFNDIQGIDDAKQEVMELVDTLRNPGKYAILGARAPTGLLLEGPPGTGKTMLARATAAAAGVPLIYASGSDFVEMFVGRGAARVRKLFERANRMAPAIIFIDELDALGKSRDSGNPMMGSRGNDEAEQTLNQLLACMDGLDSTRRICVLAATNRREVLDTALIRPGRFDRIVKLSLPDASGRENILRIHCSKLPGFLECKGVDEERLNSLGVGEKVDLSAVAALTTGFSGAELEFLVNESAIRAVRRVSASLRKGEPETSITPHVCAEDFEESLANFFATRRPKGNNVNDILKNVWNGNAQ
eukprot:CAMPEP_0201115762 /NCGR_PEP_ID=MMETSP0850-20130426/152_1 /ASSEMBLY_ACC=CAM_ASM_000622 /TAXON_ID=183588 /ORGANISM="Pseudo-nitzschia fraudulenta, Strain WWA7" /LENGTH=606 /DNA_ID=CAMNT_0047379569 /DNA_START=243 /DNA_END=2063 /DNA_ORIENTATION=-